MTGRALEFSVFVAVAVTLHLAFFLRLPPGGAEASGAGGEDFVTLLAASAQVETMVVDWKRPPATATATPRQTPPAPTVLAPPAPSPDLVALPRPERPEDPVRPRPDDTIRLPEPPLADRPTELAPQETPLPRRREPPRSKPTKTAETAQQASAGRAGQRAAGSGGGAQAGRGTQPVKAGSGAQAASLKQAWGAKIRMRIERAKRYPPGRRQKAEVRVALTVNASGRLQGAALVRSSGIAAFDQAALQAVRRAGRFPKAPAGLGVGVHDFAVTLRFE